MLSTYHLACNTMRLRATNLEILPIKDLCGRINSTPGEVEESFVKTEVKVSGDLAMVWARNKIWIDGNLVLVSVMPSIRIG